MYTAIGAIVSLTLLILKLVMDYRNEKRSPRTLEQEVQLLHNSIAKGDADTLSDLFDGMRKPPGKSHKVRYDDPTPT